MILRISSILLLLIIVPAAFIYLVQLQFKRKKWRRRLFLLPNVLLLIATAFFASTDTQIDEYAMAVAVYLVAFLLVTVPETLYALIFGVSLIFRNRKIWRIGSWLGLVAAACSMAFIITAVLSCYTRLKVYEHVYVSHDIPKAFDGYKIVHVTDFHLGTFRFYPPAVSRIVDTVNARHPDMIAFTGDIVNFSPSEMERFGKQLSRLRAKDGVVSVLGNHDYLTYIKYNSDSERVQRIKQLIDGERKWGWQLLLNSNIIIRRGEDSIAVIGSENDGRKPFPQRGDLPKAMRGVENAKFKLLLTHDPTQWRKKVLPQTDIQLTLSGHTHAGQIKIMGRSVSEMAYKEWSGLYFYGERAVFVSSGVGEALVPLRLGAWPSIDVITLRRKY